jgi:hypothetical protein
MTTRAQLRDRIRAELNDLGAVRLWPDERLQQWAVEGLRWLGRELGLELATSLTSVASQASYVLPAALVEVTRVEHPSGYFRQPVAFAGGDSTPEATMFPADVRLGPGQLTYDVYGGSLILSPAPDASGQAILVRYRASYSEPTADAGVLDVPLRDEDAVVFYVGARACEWLAMDEGKRQRFERDRGSAPADVAGFYDRQARAVVHQHRLRVAPRRLVIRGAE